MNTCKQICKLAEEKRNRIFGSKKVDNYTRNAIIYRMIKIHIDIEVATIAISR